MSGTFAVTLVAFCAYIGRWQSFAAADWLDRAIGTVVPLVSHYWQAFSSGVIGQYPD